MASFGWVASEFLSYFVEHRFFYQNKSILNFLKIIYIHTHKHTHIYIKSNIYMLNLIYTQRSEPRASKLEMGIFFPRL